MYLIKEIDFIPLREKENLILNYLSGAADVINNKLYKALIEENFSEISNETIQMLKERKYIFDDLEAKKCFEKNLINKLNELEQKELPNFLIIPTYDCNLNCIYCFEHKYKIYDDITNDEYSWVDKAFNSINTLLKNFENKNNTKINNEDIYVTLMGGEPLLYKNVNTINYIIEKIEKYKFKYNIITNGLELDKFLPILKKFKVDSIQVTLDGPKKIHDSRRVDKNQLGSYDKIIANVQKALNLNIEVYLRINIDCDNLPFLPELAQEITNNLENRNFLKPYIYLLQDGGCSGKKYIIDEVDCIKRLIKLEKQYPIMKMFEKRFHGQALINSIFKNSNPMFKLRNCSACKDQYILDYRGDIYKCWFGVGNKNFRIGTYKNKLNIDDSLDEKWHERNCINLEKCKSCKYKFICGGGCTSHIIKSSNDILKERCVDFFNVLKELLIYEYLELNE